MPNIFRRRLLSGSTLRLLVPATSKIICAGFHALFMACSHQARRDVFISVSACTASQAPTEIQVGALYPSVPVRC
eukprot:1231024-Amphidinium_carterae.1